MNSSLSEAYDTKLQPFAGQGEAVSMVIRRLLNGFTSLFKVLKCVRHLSFFVRNTIKLFQRQPALELRQRNDIAQSPCVKGTSRSKKINFSLDNLCSFHS